MLFTIDFTSDALSHLSLYSCMYHSNIGRESLHTTLTGVFVCMEGYKIFKLCLNEKLHFIVFSEQGGRSDVFFKCNMKTSIFFILLFHWLMNVCVFNCMSMTDKANFSILFIACSRQPSYQVVPLPCRRDRENVKGAWEIFAFSTH